MKRKLTVLLLTLAMALALLPATIVSAATTHTITLNKTSYAQGERIVVTVTGVTQADVATYPMAYMCTPDMAFGSKLDFYHFDGIGTNTFAFKAPDTNGNYEIRFYTNANAADTLAAKVSFTVGAWTPNFSSGIDMTINKTSYKGNEPIVITVTGITKAEADTFPIVALCTPDMPLNKWLDFAHSYDIGTNTINMLVAPETDGTYQVRLFSDGSFPSDASLVKTLNFTVGAFKSSTWATPELQKASDMGLIPNSLVGTDLTKPITRAEFAAVSVKAYENLTGKTTTPASPNPFTDTKDAEVLKAYNVGITAGTSATTFDPNTILNREQAATMLTRVLKAAYIPGWTLKTDGSFNLNFTQPPKFADDAQISDWAKPSVYFMAANGIISGVGNNTFAPKNTTTAQEATGYANATREQAIVIAARMVENLKDKTLDYSNGQQATTPAQSGSIDAKILGHWRFTSSDVPNGNQYPFIGEYTFNADATFIYKWTYIGSEVFTGKYSASGGKITFTGITSKITGVNGSVSDGVSWDKVIADYQYGTANGADYLKLAQLDYDDNPTTYDLTNAPTFARDGGGAAQAAQQPTPTPQTSQGSSSIVGKWTTSSSFDFVDPSNGSYVGNSSYIDCYEFKSNGTYWEFTSATGGNLASPGWGTEKGNYHVDGNVVYITDRTETWTDTKNAGNSYTDKSFPNTKYAIRFNDSGNLFLDDFGTDGKIITSTIKYYKVN